MMCWRERAADIFTNHGEIAEKMKSVPGPGARISQPIIHRIHLHMPLEIWYNTHVFLQGR